MITHDVTTLTIVHPPVVEHRNAATLGRDLPVRYEVIRRQLGTLHTEMGLTTSSALSLSQPENTHLDEGHKSTYLAQAAATAAFMAEALYNSSMALQHAAHLYGYDTSELAPVSRDIADLHQGIQEAYRAFSAVWSAR